EGPSCYRGALADSHRNLLGPPVDAEGALIREWWQFRGVPAERRGNSAGGGGLVSARMHQGRVQAAVRILEVQSREAVRGSCSGGTSRSSATRSARGNCCDARQGKRQRGRPRQERAPVGGGARRTRNGRAKHDYRRIPGTVRIRGFSPAVVIEVGDHLGQSDWLV